MDRAAPAERFTDAAGGRQSDAAGNFTPQKPKLTTRRGSTVTAKAISWLWLGWLALGKLHILGGHKGAGKSTTVFDWLARITRGSEWPDGTHVIGSRGRVLVWSSEDDVDDTIHPRFLAAGGDPDMVEYVGVIRNPDGTERPFDPAYDIGALLELVRSMPDLRAIMIDPIVSAVAGDGHKNNDVRRALQPLVDLAAERGIAVIGITHFTKNTQGRTPIERITGSLAYGAVSRIAMAAIKGQQQDDHRRLVRIAANISKEDGGGFDYTVETTYVKGEDGQNIETSCIHWGAVLTGSAGDLVEDLENGGEGGAVQKAMVWLKKTLGQNGAMPVPEVMSAAQANGHSRATIYRAREAIGDGIAAKATAGGDGRTWIWSLHETFQKAAIRVRQIKDPNAEHIRSAIAYCRAGNENPVPTSEIAKVINPTGADDMARRIEAKARAGKLPGWWWEENGALLWCGDEAYAELMRTLRL